MFIVVSLLLLIIMFDHLIKNISKQSNQNSCSILSVGNKKQHKRRCILLRELRVLLQYLYIKKKIHPFKRAWFLFL